MKHVTSPEHPRIQPTSATISVTLISPELLTSPPLSVHSHDGAVYATSEQDSHDSHVKSEQEAQAVQLPYVTDSLTSLSVTTVTRFQCVPSLVEAQSDRLANSSWASQAFHVWVSLFQWPTLSFHSHVPAEIEPEPVQTPSPSSSDRSVNTDPHPVFIPCTWTTSPSTGV